MPLGKRLERADRVDAADEASHPLERLAAVELRRPAALPREQREAQVAMVMQGFTGQAQRRNDRQLAPGELGRKCMLLEDGRIAPAAGAIELRDERRAFVEVHLIAAVLVAVAREQPSIRAKPARLERVEY